MRGSFYKKNEAKEWENTAGWLIKNQWKNKKPIQQECYVEITIYYSHNIDVDAYTKIVHDLLQKQRVIQNDTLIVSAKQNKYKILNTYPHIKVYIKEITEYKIGQKVEILPSAGGWDAKTGIITKIEYDTKGEFGSYLVENDNPPFIGWLTELQIRPITN